MSSRAQRARDKRLGKRRARDFRAGIEAAGDTAVRTIAPMIMRRYFVRGLLVGCAVGLAIGVVLGSQL